MLHRLLFLTLLFSLVARADAPPIEAKDLPRSKPLSVEESIKAFHLHPGLRIELAATEPNICSPVAIAFDEDSRMYVTEMRDYPDQRDKKIATIRLLESTKGDGFYDKSTVFAEGLQWPTSLCCWDGGVFVCASPDIIYFKDTKGTGHADVRKVVFTGFGPPKGEKLNVQGMVNGLTFRPDGRIYGTTSENGGMVTCADHPEVPAMDVRGKGFSFDPRKNDLRPENGGGQYGISWDDWGREYVCSNSHEIQTFLYDSRYADRNPAYAMPPTLVDLAGPAGEVFRISPEEAWRVIRTQWRKAGEVSGPVEGGGRASGYFTSASGITIYRGDALPKDFQENAFIAEPAGNLVSRKLITDRFDIQPKAIRAAEEQHVEFLASPDLFFRPVQLANGPDGALYVVDFYREVIEHPWSLPDNMRALLDLHSGADRGRIWRIVGDDFKPQPLPKLSGKTTAELVDLVFSTKEGWVRDTATRLLFERGDRAVIAQIKSILDEKKITWERAKGALYAAQMLRAWHALDEQHALRLLHYCSFITRNVIKAVEPLLPENKALRDDLLQLADRATDVFGFQIALSIGVAPKQDRLPILTLLSRKYSAQPLVRAAIISSSAGIEADLCAAIASDPKATELLEDLAAVIGGQAGGAPVIEKLADERFKAGDKAAAFALLAAVRAGAARAHVALTANDASTEILKAATESAKSSDSVPAQTAAIALLGTTDFVQSGTILLSLLDPHQSQDIQSAALTALGKFSAPEVGPALVGKFKELSPRLRSETIAILLQRPDRVAALLDGVAKHQLQPNDIPSPRQSFLRSYKVPKLRQLARKLLVAPTGGRDDVIKQYMPALSLTGDAAKGKLIYEQRCISCHRLAGEGFAVGPDLTTVRAAGKEKMLVNILDPNREVAPNFMAYVVETKSGDSLTGILVNESASSLTVREAFGKETVVLRSDLKKMASQKLSLMPEGVEAGLSNQDVADLLEFLTTAKGEK